MIALNLNAANGAQQRIKAYLEENASAVLAEKINNGVTIEKDGKALINKKTLDGFMAYATEEARKISEKNARCACIEDSVVFDWAIHYFEEDSIEGKLYNEDGTEYAKPVPQKEKPKTEPITKKETASAEKKPAVANEKAPEELEVIQMSLFDFLNG